MTEAPATGSRDYWADPASYPDNWAKRAAVAADLIGQSGAVLDIGCGARLALGNLLHPSCTYTPADLYRWNDAVIVVDLDAGQFPVGAWDWTAFLGVIEYLERPWNALAAARRHSAGLLLSYCHPALNADPENRTHRGWINAFDQDQLSAGLSGSGWRIDQQVVLVANARIEEILYRCC